MRSLLKMYISAHIKSTWLYKNTHTHTHTHTHTKRTYIAVYITYAHLSTQHTHIRQAPMLQRDRRVLQLPFPLGLARHALWRVPPPPAPPLGCVSPPNVGAIDFSSKCSATT